MNQDLCIVGDVVTDITLPQDENEIKVRLGGIVHCARSLWAMDIDYDIRYISPNYLSKSINTYCKHHGARTIKQIGLVSGAPYSFLIGSAKETGNQNYDFILRDQIELEFSKDELKRLAEIQGELLIISGNFDLDSIVSHVTSTKVHLHLDLSNNVNNFEELKNISCQTIFISTSSELFKTNYDGSFPNFCKKFEKYCKVLVLKENRGGSRIFDFENKKTYQIPSITQPIIHSVGVGDVFDTCFVAKYNDMGIEKAGYLASWVASEYAITTYPDNFKTGVAGVLKTKIEDIISMGGCFLPWEQRPLYSIYIAAPDFDYLDTSKIELLVESLLYHNFKPRRPIKENGQLDHYDEKEKRSLTYSKDIALLKECKLLIAIYINDDPGTMIELGYAKSLGIPCLLYDPYSNAYNCMLTELPQLVSSDLDVIISEVFNIISKING
ncbi:nucleoside 2-deoxyribosyltransferase [Flagellimonas sp.]|uniref:nucleoside 2-deoxyribosyltransferase n=1 Tax=Flagellimonas sp. TaxID=2058762 RepID=UPI003BAFA1AB